MELPFYKIASNLNIASSTAHSTYRWFITTSNVVTSKRGKEREELKKDSELLVIGLILHSPTLYLSEVCQKAFELTGITVSAASICRLFKRYGITRKKVRQVALQRCYTVRGAFMAQCLMFKREMLVWTDETGSDSRNHIRKYGYSLRGMTTECHRLLFRGNRINAISAMSSDGMVALDVTTSTVNGETFFDFLRGTLIPNMLPFNGSNPRSILLLDNCSVHHSREVKDLLDRAGILVFFLPPFSPDLNPIEELFSYVKGFLKKHDELLQVLIDPVDIIRSAFESVTPQQCNGWITHSGYCEESAFHVHA